MYMPRKRKLQLESNRVDLFSHPIWTNNMAKIFLLSPEIKVRCSVDNHAWLPTTRSQSKSCLLAWWAIARFDTSNYLWTYYLLHRSNMINSCPHSRISDITNSKLQWKIRFITKNYKGRQLFGTDKTNRIQSKVARAHPNYPSEQLHNITKSAQDFCAFNLINCLSLDDEMKTLHVHTQEQKAKQTRNWK